MSNQQDSTENKLDKVDSYLTKFGIILKKHWGKLLLILFGYCVYWAFTQPMQEPEPVQEQVQEYYDDSTYYYEDDSSYVEE